VGRVLFDQAATRRLQVRIGNQTTRSIDDEDEDDYEAPWKFRNCASIGCPILGTDKSFPKENSMNAVCGLIDREQFFTLLDFSDHATVQVCDRMAGDLPDELDNRLRALAGGKLGLAERNCLLEKLIDRPELVRRLAQYLEDELSAEE
jgi:hypothetical protein